VLLLSANRPDALSTTALGSQDVVIATAALTIEPGPEPLYLVVAVNDATIWRVSGAVERLERLVLTSATTRSTGRAPNDPPLVGATGVPARKLAFLNRSTCISTFNDSPSIASTRAALLIAREAGRTPEVIPIRKTQDPVTARNYQHSVAGISVPSGELRTTGRDYGDEPFAMVQTARGTRVVNGIPGRLIIESEPGPRVVGARLRQSYRGRVVDVDPEDVVSTYRPERYIVLPQNAGLLQLVQSGALRMNNGGEFLITQKIRIPPGLEHAYSAKFLLLRGVPEPDGAIAYESVISEETGIALPRRPGP